jgi:tetratricopeptide (TPR) repeat protein
MRHVGLLNLVLALAVSFIAHEASAQMVFGGGSTSTGGAGGYGELKVGDPAPGLDIEYWYPDEPQKIDQGVCYIIDFWDPRNPKCSYSMSLLAALQQKHRNRGLKVISVTKADDELVQAYRQINLDIELHTLAVDREEKTTRAWQNASKKTAIPTCFVVDRAGKIVHIGSPLDENFVSIVLFTVLDRWDSKLLEQVRAFITGARRAAAIKNYHEAYRLYDMAIKEEPRILAPYAVERLEVMLTKEKNYEKGYEYAKELLKNYESDPFTLAYIADLIATDADVEQRNFEVAMALAEKAVAQTRGQDPDHLSTLADVFGAKDDFAGAIKHQTQAYMMAVPMEKAYHKRRLEEFQRLAQGGARRELETKEEAKPLQTLPATPTPVTPSP